MDTSYSNETPYAVSSNGKTTYMSKNELLDELQGMRPCLVGYQEDGESEITQWVWDRRDIESNPDQDGRIAVLESDHPYPKSEPFNNDGQGAIDSYLEDGAGDKGMEEMAWQIDSYSGLPDGCVALRPFDF